MRVVLLCSVFSLILLRPCPGAENNPKPLVAVMDFDTSPVRTQGRAIGRSVADLLVTGLVREGHCEVIERKHLEDLLKEIGLRASDAVDQESVPRLGRIKGIDIIILGTVTRYEQDEYKNETTAQVQINARLVNIETSKIIGVPEGKGAATARSKTHGDATLTEALARAVADLARNVSNQFPAPVVTAQHDPTRPDPRERERHQDATASLARDAAQQPQNAQAWYDLGNAYMNAKQWQSAIDAFTRSVHLLPLPTTYYNRAACYINLQQHALALNDLNALLALQPHNNAALYNRAVCHRQLGHTDLAIDDFSTVITTVANRDLSMRALQNRAQLLEQLGKTAEAKRDQENAKALAHSKQ